MKPNSLETFISKVRNTWGPLKTETVKHVQHQLTELTRANEAEAWLAALKNDPRDSVELYRDLEHGFVLLAHTEKPGLYRGPHDHGSAWVIYAVQSGEMEMSTYALVSTLARAPTLVERETYRIRPGESRVYLPGDIHATTCLAPTLMFRFTSCDLKTELKEGRMNRYENK
ncbi:MAG TPA: hypothetical protein VFV50_07925 [Bdellovibrionales bacterium]|nr:hypothetical protein [Bdellovibrionales bacterium]